LHDALSTFESPPRTSPKDRVTFFPFTIQEALTSSVLYFFHFSARTICLPPLRAHEWWLQRNRVHSSSTLKSSSTSFLDHIISYADDPCSTLSFNSHRFVCDLLFAYCTRSLSLSLSRCCSLVDRPVFSTSRTKLSSCDFSLFSIAACSLLAIESRLPAQSCMHLDLIQYVRHYICWFLFVVHRWRRLAQAAAAAAAAEFEAFSLSSSSPSVDEAGEYTTPTTTPIPTSITRTGCGCYGQ